MASVERVDGGRFFRGVIVKVERIDLFDFKVIFTPAEGKDIVDAAKESDHTVEQIVSEIIVYGFETFYNS